MIDIITAGKVLFNITDNTGRVRFSTFSSRSPSPVEGGERPDTNLIIIDPREQEKLIDDNPLEDMVRMWTAPLDGLIAIDAPVALFENKSSARLAYDKADGVKVAIQHNNVEISNITISAKDYSRKNFSARKQVSKGDRVYFRVQSNINGAYDQLSSNPIITYESKDLSLRDANGKQLYRFNASEDYVWTGTGIFLTPFTGAITWVGSYHQPKVSDMIWNVVIKNKVDTLYQSHAASDTSIIFNRNWQVNKGDVLEFKVISKSNVNWPAFDYTARIFYTSSSDAAVPAVQDNAGNYLIN